VPRSPDEVDRWIRDHEAQHARDREERRIEDGRLIDAVKKHVDGALRPIGEMNAKIDKLIGVNDEQLAIARESAEERGRRMQREADAAAKKSDEQLELERAKVAAAEKAAADAKALKELEQKNDKLKAWLGAAAAVLVALIGAYFAVRR